MEVHGKIKLNAQIFLMPKRDNVHASVYVHLKGYARARVSHLDIEKVGLGKVIHRGRGNFLQVNGIKQGIKITIRESKEIEIDRKKSEVSSVIVFDPLKRSFRERQINKGLGWKEIRWYLHWLQKGRDRKTGENGVRKVWNKTLEETRKAPIHT